MQVNDFDYVQVEAMKNLKAKMIALLEEAAQYNTENADNKALSLSACENYFEDIFYDAWQNRGDCFQSEKLPQGKWTEIARKIMTDKMIALQNLHAAESML